MGKTNPTDEAIEFTKEVLDLLNDDPKEAMAKLSAKVILYDDVSSSMEVLDKISERFLDLEVKGADKKILEDCESKIRERIKELGKISRGK